MSFRIDEGSDDGRVFLSKMAMTKVLMTVCVLLGRWFGWHLVSSFSIDEGSDEGCLFYIEDGEDEDSDDGLFARRWFRWRFGFSIDEGSDDGCFEDGVFVRVLVRYRVLALRKVLMMAALFYRRR